MATPQVKKLEDWVAEAKIENLYHPEGDVTIPTLMLERTKVNAKNTERQARLTVAYLNLIDCLPERYMVLKQLVDYSSDITLTVNGYSRKQAIEAEGKHVSGEQQEQKKKGILGMLGIG